MAIITISRGIYTGGEALAECLSNELGYRLVSREDLLTDVAAEYGASKEQLESALMHKPGFLEGRGLRRLHYIYCVQAGIASVIQSDNVVYHGQAGHVLLKGIAHHLRVRVVAAMEHRINAAMERCDLTREKAREYLKELDGQRDNWMRWVHGIDTSDPALFDLVINLERITIAGACALVARTATDHFQRTAEAQKAVDDLVLTSAIRARIGQDPSISDDRVDIDAKDGVVTITAKARALAEVDRVRDVVQAIPGVKEVHSKIGPGS
jgi:cytidylate kinase